MKRLIPFLLLLIVLSSCSQGNIFLRPSATPTPTGSPTPSQTPTVTATFTASPQRTPPALPDGYLSGLLNPRDLPHPYVSDTCQYLKDKWSSSGSPPGTVVMPIMFHSITGDAVTQDNQISETDFRALMLALHDKGFQAITMTQMMEFMERNAKIPERSVLLIADDRHPRAYFDNMFFQYWTEWNWPVVNAWIATPLNTQDLWAQQEALNAEGWVDYQAHGVDIYPMWPGASTTYIQNNLQGSMDAFLEHFGKTPIAIIWPGGGFSEESVAAARQLDYRLGFTTSPRGPLMYNWVPLADGEDDMRPSWAPEGGVNDPLLVLPRYWNTDAIQHIDQVIQISQEAAAYAREHQSTEQEYYDIVCAPEYGPIP